MAVAEDQKSRPLASVNHLASMFCIERGSTLLLLLAIFLAAGFLPEQERSSGVAQWLIILICCLATIAARLSLPFWCLRLLKVYPTPGYVAQAWPTWLAEIAAPILAIGFILGYASWISIGAAFVAAALILAFGQKPPAARPVALPPPALAVLEQADIPPEKVQLIEGRRDLIAWAWPRTALCGDCSQQNLPVIFISPTALENFSANELAAALAHEAAHVRLNHINRIRILDLTWWLFTVVAILGARLRFWSHSPWWSHSETVAAVTAVFLAATILQTVGVAVVALFGRGQEYEANARALKYIEAAGIDAAAFHSMLVKVHELAGSPGRSAWWYRLFFGDYPTLQEQLERLKG